MWNQENEMPHVLVRFLRLCVGAKRQNSTKLASSVEPVNKASLDAPHREPQAQFTREEKLAEIGARLRRARRTIRAWYESRE